MQSPNVKELEALIKMLRRHGVSDFEGHGLKLRIDAPIEKPKNGTASNDKIESDGELDEDSLLFWSSGVSNG